MSLHLSGYPLAIGLYQGRGSVFTEERMAHVALALPGDAGIGQRAAGASRAGQGQCDRTCFGQDRSRGARSSRAAATVRRDISPSLQPLTGPYRPGPGQTVPLTLWPGARCRASTEAVHVASHALAVSDMDEDEGQTLIDCLNERMTGPSHIHDHHWRPGKVLVWDERGATRRGAPWPSDQARRPVSCCTSHGDADGLSETRP